MQSDNSVNLLYEYSLITVSRERIIIDKYHRQYSNIGSHTYFCSIANSGNCFAGSYATRWMSSFPESQLE
jgi:hypothetical protein